MLQRKYWCGSTTAAQDVTLAGAQRTPRNAEFIEEEPIGLKAGIQIKGLTKAYHRDRLAVNQVHQHCHLLVVDDRLLVVPVESFVQRTRH